MREKKRPFQLPPAYSASTPSQKAGGVVGHLAWKLFALVNGEGLADALHGRRARGVGLGPLVVVVVVVDHVDRR